jgi:transglutaminase/protease-like cytokinesis protein 3
MLRSTGIPAKLVKGYANYNPGVYHAWNEVYLDGQWHVIDTTLDASTGIYDEIFKDASDYTKVSEY